ncbi:MAG TPA: AsnC family protein [Acetobacteraceae bacterium]
MPKKLIWTDAQDCRIKRLRAEGASWDAIAAALGITCWTVMQRGRRIGARLPPPGAEPPAEDPFREALPAGHPRSWNAINAGTALEGAPYPYPVFD